MADKKLNEVTKVTDMAYVPVIMSDGSIGQIAKADLASVVAASLPTQTATLADGESHNFGYIFGLIRITISNPKTYSIPSFLIVTGGGVVWLYRGWYISEDSVIISDYELILTNKSSTQTFYVTKLG